MRNLDPTRAKWIRFRMGLLCGTMALGLGGFFRALELILPWDVDGVSDAMPVEIDQLETWGVGDRMLEDMMRGIHPDNPVNRAREGGVQIELPPRVRKPGSDCAALVSTLAAAALG